MSNLSLEPASTTGSRLWLVPIVLIAVALAGWWLVSLRNQHRDESLLRAEGESLPSNAQLMAYATQKAAPVYKEHCASCHGADLKGQRDRGIPNLQDSVWLYGTGKITDIEQTILYGIRSGHPKAHNLADMPGLGRVGQITAAESHDVVEYVLKISKQPHDETAVERGKFVFMNHGACYDCHSADGYGVSDYGTPGLTGRGDSWVYGGDRATLYKSVFDGRHGKCPAWINTLSFAEIRALAAYLYQQSHGDSNAQPTSGV